MREITEMQHQMNVIASEKNLNTSSKKFSTVEDQWSTEDDSQVRANPSAWI